ncbi:MAG: hypothetical protein ACJAS3_001784 [Roseivirga sp.]|jgi:hypothetical protein
MKGSLALFLMILTLSAHSQSLKTSVERYKAGKLNHSKNSLKSMKSSRPEYSEVPFYLGKIAQDEKHEEAVGKKRSMPQIPLKNKMRKKSTVPRLQSIKEKKIGSWPKKINQLSSFSPALPRQLILSR